jgi:hypothetical protein
MASDEPWTRYRTLVDLLDRPQEDAQVQATLGEMLAHRQIRALIAEASTWGDRPLKRHNDAGHPIYAFSTLADFGLQAGDPGLGASVDAVLAHQSPAGAFQTLLNIPPRFGGTGEDTWTWLPCDAPTLLYAVLALNAQGPIPSDRNQRIQMAADHLASQVEDNGWRCRGSPEVGRFRGPGRKTDPCPIANVYALKALSLVPHLADSRATRAGTETLLGHWERQAERKIYLFGIGTDYRKLKYPFVWYNVLHVVEVLSRFPFVHADPRFLEMVQAITCQADGGGRYTATSMYRAWKGWSFANKKEPSPWLTYLVLRILQRLETDMTRSGP